MNKHEPYKSKQPFRVISPNCPIRTIYTNILNERPFAYTVNVSFISDAQSKWISVFFLKVNWKMSKKVS